MPYVTDPRSGLELILAICCLYIAVRMMPAVFHFLRRPMKSTPAGRVILWLASICFGVLVVRWVFHIPSQGGELLATVALVILARAGYDLYGLRRHLELQALHQNRSDRTASQPVDRVG